MWEKIPIMLNLGKNGNIYIPRSQYLYMVGKSPPKNWREKDMRENMEVGWIEENEFQKVLSEASARMTKSTGQTCHIKGRGNYFKRRE